MHRSSVLLPHKQRGSGSAGTWTAAFLVFFLPLVALCVPVDTFREAGIADSHPFPLVTEREEQLSLAAAVIAASMHANSCTRFHDQDL